MVTQKFMGSGQLVDRLTAQVKDRGFAMSLLKKRGDMNSNGSLTPKGEARNQMTAEERAIDRAERNPEDVPQVNFITKFWRWLKHGW